MIISCLLNEHLQTGDPRQSSSLNLFLSELFSLKCWWVEGWGSTVLENMFSGFLQNKEKSLPRVKSVSASSPESIKKERPHGLRRELLPRLAAFKVLDYQVLQKGYPGPQDRTLTLLQEDNT